MSKQYPVTFVTKDDIRHHCADTPEKALLINEIDEETIVKIASAMEEEYVNQLFWDSLETAVQKYVFDKEIK